MSAEATAAEVVVEIPAIPENAVAVIAREHVDGHGALALRGAFAPYFAELDAIAKQAQAICSQPTGKPLEVALARTLRLAARKIRTTADKTREELGADALRYKRAVDGVFAVVRLIAEPMESRLKEIEEFAERAEAARLAAIKAERVELLTKYGVDCAFYALDVMPAEQFEQLLAGSKAAHEAKIEAARKAEEERAAKIAAEAAERERIRVENERLKREAVEAEKAAQAERERVAKEKHEAELKARKEREEMEAAMRQQKLEADAKAKAAADAAAEEARKIKAEADRLAKIAADKAKAEREAIEAEARKLAAEAEAKADAERAELRRQAKAAADAQAKAEAEAKAIRDAEAARVAAEEAARKKAASSCDRDKVLMFAGWLREIPALQLSSADGKELSAAIHRNVGRLADFCEEKGGAL